jgi:hypothetical protein
MVAGRLRRAQPSPTIGQCISGGLGWIEVECNRCKTRASLPLDAIRRPRDTPVWKLEASLKCRFWRKGRYAPPVHMIKLTEREITPDRDRGWGRQFVYKSNGLNFNAVLTASFCSALSFP